MQVPAPAAKKMCTTRQSAPLRGRHEQSEVRCTRPQRHSALYATLAIHALRSLHSTARRRPARHPPEVTRVVQHVRLRPWIRLHPQASARDVSQRAIGRRRCTRSWRQRIHAYRTEWAARMACHDAVREASQRRVGSEETKQPRNLVIGNIPGRRRRIYGRARSGHLSGNQSLNVQSVIFAVTN